MKKRIISLLLAVTVLLSAGSLFRISAATEPPSSAAQETLPEWLTDAAALIPDSDALQSILPTPDETAQALRELADGAQTGDFSDFYSTLTDWSSRTQEGTQSDPFYDLWNNREQHSAACRIGQTVYSSVTLALAAEHPEETASSPTVITLLCDCTENITVESGRYITLDLAGNVLQGTGTGSVITNRGSLTVNGGSPVAVHVFAESETVPGLWVWSSAPVLDTVRHLANGGLITGGGISDISGTVGTTDGSAIYNTGTLVLNNLNLAGNLARSGAVYNAGGSSFSAAYCTFSGNRAASGAAVANLQGAAARMEGCAVSGNSAAQWGSAILQNGSMIMKSTAVSGNTLTPGEGIRYQDYGGCIVLGEGAALTLEGTVYVFDNHLNALQDNLFIQSSDGVVSCKDLLAGSKIGIYLSNSPKYSYFEDKPLTVSFTDATARQAYAGYFVSDAQGFAVRYAGDNARALQLIALQTVQVYSAADITAVNNGTSCINQVWVLHNDIVLDEVLRVSYGILNLTVDGQGRYALKGRQLAGETLSYDLSTMKSLVYIGGAIDTHTRCLTLKNVSLVTNQGFRYALQAQGDATGSLNITLDGATLDAGNTARLTNAERVKSTAALVASGAQITVKGSCRFINNQYARTMIELDDTTADARLTFEKGASVTFTDRRTDEQKDAAPLVTLNDHKDNNCTVLAEGTKEIGLFPVAAAERENRSLDGYDLPGFDNRFGSRYCDPADYTVDTIYRLHDSVRYTFAGWYTQPDGEGAALDGKPTAVTYYAKWTDSGKTVVTCPLDLRAAGSADRQSHYGWKWDAATHTLTLCGLTLDCSGQTASGTDVAGILLPDTAGISNTIQLSGKALNTVIAPQGGEVRNSAIRAANADIVIDGSGTLNLYGGKINGGQNSLCCGVYADQLTVKNGRIYLRATAVEADGNGAHCHAAAVNRLDVLGGAVSLISRGTVLDGGTVRAPGALINANKQMDGIGDGAFTPTVDATTGKVTDFEGAKYLKIYFGSQPVCKYGVPFAAGSGLTLLLGDEDAGTFTVTGNASRGFALQADDGSFLAVADQTVTPGDSPFSWKYDGGLYIQSTITRQTRFLFWTVSSEEEIRQYLSVMDGVFLLNDTTVSAELQQTVASHDFSYLQDDDGICHRAVCTRCGYQLQAAVHKYTADGSCICGKLDPELCFVTDVSVAEQKVTTQSGFWFWTKTTTKYSYTVTPSAQNTGVCKVEYTLAQQPDTDTQWKSGPYFTLTEPAERIFIRVTDNEGHLTVWSWADGTVTQVLAAK